MSQLSLFQTERPAPAPRPADPAFVRRHLAALLRLAQSAQRMPWGEAEAGGWEKLFPELTEALPSEEGEALRTAFARELARLRAVD